MSATTTLKFTLTSPGTDPTPTPPTPGDTTTTTTTTTTTPVSYPNTGENTSSDNFSGSVFMTLFAVIGLAALAIFLIKYFKKNRKFSFAEKGSFHLSARPRVFATAGLVLAVALLGSAIIGKLSAGWFADAATIEREVTAKSEIIFDVDRGQAAIASDTISVANNGDSYKLYISTTDSKFCLEGSTTDCLSSVTGDITSTDAAKLTSVSTNQWGISLTDQTAIDGKIWAAAPTSEKLIYTGTGSSTSVKYAVNLGEDLPNGTYYAKVSYRAVSEVNPDIEYTVIVNNGYVGKEGTETTEDFKSGVQVWIRQNCGTKTFLGWQIEDESLPSLDVIKKSTDVLYYFIMPANDVEVTALCEGDTPTPASWVIKYNANAPSGQTASGTMANTEVTGDSATLRTNAFTITNYVFQGWSCTSGDPTNTSLVHFSNSQSGITKSALEAKGCTKSGSPDTYNLYAIWQYQAPTVTYIQDVTPEMCDNMDYFEVKTLPDRRDSKNYSYTKYADGRCWMLSDLAYAPGSKSVTLTVADTDVSTERSVTFVENGTSGSALYKTQSGYSTLYNYNAATGGYWSNWSSKAANKVVPDSLCPASWKIPDASYGPRIIDGSLTNDQAFGVEAGEFYGLWNANIGAAYGGGESKGSTWKTQTFIFGSGTHTHSGKTVTYPHFTYNGAWNFSDSSYADEGGNAANGAAGKYASYFLNTTVTRNGSIAPAAYNPHKPGVESGDPDIEGIGDTDPAHGSSIRCVLRTAEERTNRHYAAGGTDMTD